ncbi:permease [Pullulanibacillus camelliae]|uniref:Permease n=1 Tax=Pullulanibacillus camelliae TaxID=1707096 RepID=A0A8J2YF52_9BACL|nr:EamA family transporter [Pullulanibacillus camelliae]GGE40474.1 permease [Pullulanibacillus camelliae]
MKTQQRKKGMGLAFVLISATLWGVSGTVAQYLFSQHGLTPAWLVDIRLLCSGAVLLLITAVKQPQQFILLLKSKRDIMQLLLFGLIGMLGVQYTYFAAIKAGNAATATLLQYLAPVIIVFYLSIRTKALPHFVECIAILLSIIGTFLLVTNGSAGTLSLSKSALFWGLAAAFALAYYTLQPSALLSRWSSLMIVGGGMVIGGVVFSFVQQPWRFSGSWSMWSMLAIVFVVILGTLVPFYLYVESLKYIQPSEASLLACAEPLSAAILSVIWLHVKFGLSEWIGALCIIMTIILLALKQRMAASKQEVKKIKL